MSKKIEMKPWQWATGMIVCALFGGLVNSADLSFADNNPATSNIGQTMVVPYEGYLMMDSSPLTGTQEMKFALYEAATGGSAEWIETQTVQMYSGRFSVGLGTGTKDASITQTFSDVVLDGQQLYLAISVYDANAQAWIELSGRQAIEAVPYSAWSANSADFKTNGNLTVSGSTTTNALQVDTDATVTGATTTGSLNVTGLTQSGSLNVTGATQTDSLGVTNVATVGSLSTAGTISTTSTLTASGITSNGTLTSTGLGTIGGDLYVKGDVLRLDGTSKTALYVNGSDQLYINPASAFGGGTYFGSNVQANYNVTVAGSTSLQDTDVNGDLDIKGSLSFTGSVNWRTGFAKSVAVPKNSSMNATLISTSLGFCFLSSMQVNDTAQNPGAGSCAVTTSNGSWILTGTAGSDLTIACSAYCVY